MIAEIAGAATIQLSNIWLALCERFPPNSLTPSFPFPRVPQKANIFKKLCPPSAPRIFSADPPLVP